MNISKKQPIQQKAATGRSYKSPVVVDWTTYELDVSATIPYGKNIGKTLGWLIQHDTSYYEWLEKEQLFGSWGLVKQKQQQVKTLHTEVGDRWIELVEYNIPTASAPSSWWYQ